MTSFSPVRPFVGTQRNELRKLARNHPDFDRWRALNDPKNEMKKAEIIRAVNDLGLVAQAEAILGAPQASTLDSEAFDDHSDTALDTALDEASMAKSDEGDTNEPSPIDVDIESVLGPVRPFLAGGLIANIEAALRPIVVQAHKPAQTIIVQSNAPLKAGEAAHARRIGVSTMSKVFMVGGAKGKRPVALWDDPLAPRPDAGYVMDGARMYLGASAFEAGETVWFAGPAGAGKTTLAKEYAALTGRGFVRIGFNHSTEMIDLIGQPEPQPANENGGVKMVWRDGVFTRAIRRAGTMILLDELTGAPPGTSMAFQTILDERQLTLPTGEVVNFADGVVVAIADNTAGYGDESGVYAGTQAANGALVDRAVRLVPVDYMSALLEAEALQRRTGAPQAACIRLADFAVKVRTVQAQNKSDSRPFSIRRLIAFANATHRDLMTCDEAWTITAYSRLPELDREELRQAVNAHFDGKAYVRELKGEAAPIDPVQMDFSMGAAFTDAIASARQAQAKRAFGAVDQA
jgi:cobaltochelatase CobS